MAGTIDSEDKALQVGAGLDVSRSDRAVWLLKVPPMVSHAWQRQTDGGSNLAKVLLSFDPTKADSESALEFSMELSTKETTGIPKGYGLNFTKDLIPMYIFSETAQGKLAVEGKVEHKFDMKPNDFSNDEYRRLCRERLHKYTLKARPIQVLENDYGDLMRPSPVAAWPISTSKKKAPAAKAPEAKRIRIERGDLEDMIFKLFEGQSHWALKQLVAETQQPEAFLKEVMSDLCVYNKRGPNQGKYELKPEYKRKPSEEEIPTS
eukprot:c22906_g1_i1 orf=743-1531(-)